MDVSVVLSMVLSAVQTFIKVEPQLAQTVNDLKPFAVALYQEWTGQAPTAAQETLIVSSIDAMFGRLETPLPPAQPGDPDFVA